MRATCSARTRHCFYRMVRGRLGLHMAAVPADGAPPGLMDRPEQEEEPDGVLCLGVDGSVVSLRFGDRRSPLSKARLALQAKLQALPPGPEMEELSGVRGGPGGARHAAGPGAGEHPDAGRVQGLPAASVDGELLALVAGLPASSLHALASKLGMAPSELQWATSAL
jgi:hypothetical protein